MLNSWITVSTFKKDDYLRWFISGLKFFNTRLNIVQFPHILTVDLFIYIQQFSFLS